MRVSGQGIRLWGVIQLCIGTTESNRQMCECHCVLCARPSLSLSLPKCIRLLEVVHRVSSSLLGPVDPSFPALAGRLEFYGPTSYVQSRFSLLIWGYAFGAEGGWFRVYGGWDGGRVYGRWEGVDGRRFGKELRRLLHTTFRQTESCKVLKACTVDSTPYTVNSKSQTHPTPKIPNRNTTYTQNSQSPNLNAQA